MSEQSISDKIKNCISVLDFICTIPKNHKPCYKTKTTIPKDSWFVTIKRRWNGEKGEYGVEYINEILNQCDLYYRFCLDNQSNIEDLTRLSKLLSQSLSGFDNLIETYNDQLIVEKSYKECKEMVKKLINDISEIENSKIASKPIKINFFTANNVKFISNVSKHN